jgi:G3E family GTPase
LAGVELVNRVREPDTLPTTLLTGFLGSGKTTLLRRALVSPQLADTADIITESG